MVKVTGALRVQVTARGLALGGAPAGAPLAAALAFGTPAAAPGQCGVTAFASCNVASSGASVRCP